MPSRTSYFNKGLFLNNVKRFWLVTFTYALMLFLIVMSYLSMVNRQLNTYINESLLRGGTDIFLHSNEILLIFSCFFSLVAGLCVFSYMHFQRNTAMVHALPVKRETLFVTNYLSGLLLVVVPILLNGIVLLVGVSLTGIFSSLKGPLLWIVVNLIANFLFYSFAVFAGMFTGHLAAQAIFYIVFNFLARFLEAMVEMVLSSFMFGFISSNNNLNALSPYYGLNSVYVTFGRDEGDFGLLTAYLVAGLFFLISSYFLYRRRHMEVATDVISFPIVKPIFKYSVAFCSAALIGWLFVESLNIRDNVLGYILTYLLGGFIGYFVSEMLLRKTFRVFKAYKGFLVFALVLVLLLCSVSFDFYGYENRIPADNDIAMMYLSDKTQPLSKLAISPENYNPREHGYWFVTTDDYNPPRKLSDEHIRELRSLAGIIEDREAIAKARQIHAYIIENKDRLKKNLYAYYDWTDPDTYEFYYLNFIYKLSNGKLVERQYRLAIPKGDDQLPQLLREYLALPQVREKFMPILANSASDFRAMYVQNANGTNTAISDIDGFLKAYKQDILSHDPLTYLNGSGNGSQYFDFDIVIDLIDTKYLMSKSYSRYLTLSLDYTNTLNYLKEQGLITQEQIDEARVRKLEMKK